MGGVLSEERAGVTAVPESGPGLSSERRCVDMTGKPPAERGCPLRTNKNGIKQDSLWILSFHWAFGEGRLFLLPSVLLKLDLLKKTKIAHVISCLSETSHFDFHSWLDWKPQTPPAVAKNSHPQPSGGHRHQCLQDGWTVPRAPHSSQVSGLTPPRLGISI